jgi:hypothetical protein
VSINIKPENKGKYTARAKSQGRSVQGQAAHDAHNPNVSAKQRKRAVFAQNMKKIAREHKRGGKRSGRR